MADPIVEMSESIKLTKNTKGYNYEIRIRCEGKEKIDDKFIARLKDIDSKMIKEFGVAYS